MKINKKSILGRMYSWLYPNAVITNICHFGWIVFFIIPIFAIILVGGSALILLGIGIVVYQNPMQALIGFSAGIGILFLTTILALGVINFSKPDHFLVFKEWVRAKKERYCTKVELV